MKSSTFLCIFTILHFLYLTDIHGVEEEVPSGNGELAVELLIDGQAEYLGLMAFLFRHGKIAEGDEARVGLARHLIASSVRSVEVVRLLKASTFTERTKYIDKLEENRKSIRRFLKASLSAEVIRVKLEMEADAKEMNHLGSDPTVAAFAKALGDYVKECSIIMEENKGR